MRKIWICALWLLPLLGCVGKIDDPDPEPEQKPETEQPTVPNPPAPDPPTPEETGPFYRRVLALGFTATWCQYCPNMSKAIKEAEVQREDRIIPVAVHYIDELSADESNALVSLFKVTGYPSLVFDWNAATLFNGQVSDVIVGYIDKQLETETCGLAAETVVQDGVLKLDVSLQAVAAGRYSVAAAWIEDGVQVGFQAGYGSNYTCNNVLRGYLVPGIDGIDLGSIEAGDEASVSFSGEALENSRLVVYVLQDGVAVNALSIGQNQKLEYEHEKTD